MNIYFDKVDLLKIRRNRTKKSSLLTYVVYSKSDVSHLALILVQFIISFSYFLH